MKLIFMTILLLSLGSQMTFAKKDDYNAIETHNKAMKELEVVMKSKAKEAKRCSTLIRKKCGDNETKACANRVAKSLPAYCKQMIGNFAQAAGDIEGGLSVCTSVAIKKCQMVDDIGEKKGGLANMQRCLEKAMKEDTNCTDTLKQKVESAAGSDEISSDVYKEFIR